jgi:ABC-2 type transport system ATP-binding protein
VREFTDSASRNTVRVRTPQAVALRGLLAGPTVTVTTVEDGVLEVSGVSSTEIGMLACQHHLPLEELTPVKASLEEAFMELTDEDVEYRTERKAS